MRRVVQKRAEDADRRKREATLKGRVDSAADEEKKSLEKKNAGDRERLARETKVPGWPHPCFLLEMVVLRERELRPSLVLSTCHAFSYCTSLLYLIQ